RVEADAGRDGGEVRRAPHAEGRYVRSRRKDDGGVDPRRVERHDVRPRVVRADPPPPLPELEDERAEPQAVRARAEVEQDEPRGGLLPLRRPVRGPVRTDRVRPRRLLVVRVRVGGGGEVRRLAAPGDAPVRGDILRPRRDAARAVPGLAVGAGGGRRHGTELQGAQDAPHRLRPPVGPHGERRDLVWALVYLYYTVRTLSHAGDFLHSSIDKGPYNQSYMPGWGEAMGGRVLFQNDETKDVMVEENSHWQMSTGKKQMWHADCL
ncbi:hypothetical protein THAOC_19283, partial [Thalassiosira oceanica]